MDGLHNPDVAGAAPSPAQLPGPRQRLVMVGNGMAGVRTIEEILRLAPDLYDITVFGVEPHAQTRGA